MLGPHSRLIDVECTGRKGERKTERESSRGRRKRRSNCPALYGTGSERGRTGREQ